MWFFLGFYLFFSFFLSLFLCFLLCFTWSAHKWLTKQWILVSHQLFLGDFIFFSLTRWATVWRVFVNLTLETLSVYLICSLSLPHFRVYARVFKSKTAPIDCHLSSLSPSPSPTTSNFNHQQEKVYIFWEFWKIIKRERERERESNIRETRSRHSSHTHTHGHLKHAFSSLFLYSLSLDEQVAQVETSCQPLIVVLPFCCCCFVFFRPFFLSQHSIFTFNFFSVSQSLTSWN